MTTTGSNNIFTPQLRILFCIVLFEYLLFIFSGVSFSFLYEDSFFSIGADPASWIVFGLKIPQFITAHHWVGLLLDTFDNIVIVYYLSAIHLITGLPCYCWYCYFCFISTLMGYLTHRNYQVGFFMVFIPFIFKKEMNKFFAYEATRYFILIFYVTAALLKFSNNSLSNAAHFSHMLSTQFTPYFLEGNTGFALI